MQLLYSDQIPSHKQALKDMLDKVWSKFGPKGNKMGGAKFLRRVNLNFFKKDHKIGFYPKNQQNSTSHLEDISQIVDFGPERGKF